MLQRTEQWFSDRLGRITASQLNPVVEPMTLGANKGKRSEKANKYLISLACERITGIPSQCFVTKAMEDGIEREPEAIAMYQCTKGVITEECGFIEHPNLKYSGASPDFLVGEDGGGEVKCPALHNFAKWKIEGVVPKEHMAQVQWGMACTGRKWWDFVAYHPSMPHGLNLFIVRVDRDEKLIAEYEEKVIAFELEIRETVKKLKGIA